MESSPNLFDLGVLIIVGLSALLSFYRGFLREVVSLGAWIGASVVALTFIEPATAYLKPQIKSEVVASGIAAVGLFFITLIVISVATNLLLKFLKPGEKIGLFDNLAGLAFGVARGVLIVAIAFFALTIVLTEKNYPEVVKTAYSKPYVEKLAKALGKLAPDYLDKLTKGKEGGASEKQVNELIEKLDAARENTTEDIDAAMEEEADKLPSMEDLQRRIREENERNDVR